MKEKRNLHLKIQEMCDCYATSDPLKSMSDVSREGTGEDSAVKWLALAALHGIDAGAKTITLHFAGDGTVRSVAEYRPKDLPAPSAATAGKIMEVVREITHIEDAKGKLPVSLGVRDSSVDIKIKVKSDGDEGMIKLKFESQA